MSYKYTNQEAFDIAVRGVLGQGSPSISQDGSCRYRNYDGKRCAAGFLIPDEQYDPSWDSETTNWRNLVECLNPEMKELADDALVQKLQSAHDINAENPEEWLNGEGTVDLNPKCSRQYGVADRFRIVARKFNLSEAAVDEFPQYPTTLAPR